MSETATWKPIVVESGDLATKSAVCPKLRRHKGRALGTLPNLVLALTYPEWSRMRLAFDTFRDEVMLAPSGTEEWRPLTDEAITQIKHTLEVAEFHKIARDELRHAITMLAKQEQFDSAVKWLKGLPAWDGTPRVERFLVNYCHAEESDYTRAVGRYLWTALAGRVLDAGCKADMIPILVGPQGAKKTSAAAALVPAPEHFVEISFEEQDADLARKIRGRLVGEVSELRGLGTRDLEWIKSFITRTHENWIPKYMEYATTFPRRLVFIGTTNNEEFLTDDSGNRRFLPVRVDNIDLEAIRRDRLQLWAEGAGLWESSGIAWRAAEDLAPSVHAQHMVIDSWEQDIERWLKTPHGEFTTGDVLSGALHLSGATQRTIVVEKRAAKVLRSMGFRQKVTWARGRRVKVWCAAEGFAPGSIEALDARVLKTLSEEWLES
jgi:predicted P-loop ATPase